jgi:hypothetical protein
MPAIDMSRHERHSLGMIVERPRPVTDIPADHAAKLINHGLVKKEVLLLHATPLGQVELLRQRFRGLDITAA